MIRALFACALLFTAQAGSAQSLGEPPSPVSLSLGDAVAIALDQNYALRNAELDVRVAGTQIREAYSSAYPSLDASSSYTRNVVQANPFAGSDAGGLFGALGAIDWLAFNEGARTDNDPGTDPITLGEFRDRQAQGREEAGIVLEESANPFGVDNQFLSSLTLSQTLYDGSLFAAIKGARTLRSISEEGLARQAQLVITDVRQAFYNALLAQEQARVLASSVERTSVTVGEAARRVAQGTRPKFERLNAEVELANLETQLVSAENAAGLAVDNLKLLIGLPIQQTVTLRGSLDNLYDDQPLIQTVSIDDAVSRAFAQRADLRQAREQIDLQRVQRQITAGNRLPSLSAFANLSYAGNVPDNRTTTSSDPSEPFTFSQNTRGFFDDSYWDPSLAVGLRLQWNVFDGFRTKAQLQRNQIEIDRAELQLEQLTQSVALEVEAAMRNVVAAQERIRSQQRTLDNAELNYTFARTRLREGVSNPFEERQASDLLDQSRLGYIQALFDYLNATAQFDAAVGLTVEDDAQTESTTSLAP
ncbi:MAG: TolC family protein [Bacteroidota bacterium]